MASAVDSRLAYARLSAVATASRLPTANRGSNNSYTTSWDTTWFEGYSAYKCGLLGANNFSVLARRWSLEPCTKMQPPIERRVWDLFVKSTV